MWILIKLVCQKPADLDLLCLFYIMDKSGFSWTKVYNKKRFKRTIAYIERIVFINHLSVPQRLHININ